MTVRIPNSQITDTEDRGTPLSVGEAMLAFMVPVKYYDKLGKPHQEFVFVVGDVVYKDPNGENWAAKLKVISDTVATEVVQRTRSQLENVIRKVVREMGPVSASSADEVDVLADETDKDVSPTS